mmetsp:Transcript_41607/g.97407  ORF Transcript_41607/g.97407 Transcript_41607/m.97407 type:complete len:167 (-) Transcript_41607:848-1348(-)
MGTALATNPGLRRRDLKMIAVLAVDLAAPPCPDAPAPERNKTAPPPPGDDARAALEGCFRRLEGGHPDAPLPAPPAGPPPVRRIQLYAGYDDGQGGGADGGPRRPRPEGTGRRTVLVRSDRDLNPLRPCGTCNEWLKKIAEPNPGFQVVTFTDADCNGVYVSACQE